MFPLPLTKRQRESTDVFSNRTSSRLRIRFSVHNRFGEDLKRHIQFAQRAPNILNVPLCVRVRVCMCACMWRVGSSLWCVVCGMWRACACLCVCKGVCAHVCAHVCAGACASEDSAAQLEEVELYHRKLNEAHCDSDLAESKPEKNGER